MPKTSTPHTDAGNGQVAVIGSGLAGAACAAGLNSAGLQVTVFEKSKNVGGRMASRRAGWIDGSGAQQSASFDHGALCFTPVRPRFKAVMSRAMAAGSVGRWRPNVYSAWPFEAGPSLVAMPTMPALCRHVLAGTTVQLDRTVTRLQRSVDGAWHVAAEGAPLAGPFQHVVVAVPPAQAAVLLAGHQDSWAHALMARRTQPCWTLMAVTDDVDWPWDAAVPERGPLVWVLRNDRVPGRSAPAGLAVWTAHASAEWSAAHLDDDPASVRRELQSALKTQLPTTHCDGRPIRWHHIDVHRWRFASTADDGVASADGDECWWDQSLGLGVCGDFLGGAGAGRPGGIEAAWHSGDELADCMAASLERSDAPSELLEAVR